MQVVTFCVWLGDFLRVGCGHAYRVYLPDCVSGEMHSFVLLLFLIVAVRKCVVMKIMDVLFCCCSELQNFIRRIHSQFTVHMYIHTTYNTYIRIRPKRKCLRGRHF